MEPHEELRELSFTVSGIISKSIRQVYEAVADPEQLSHYFTTGGASVHMENGATVTWDFHDFPGPFPSRSWKWKSQSVLSCNGAASNPLLPMA